MEFPYYVWKALDFNISCVNHHHLPEDVDRTTSGGLKINYIECSIDSRMKETLFKELKKAYGAVIVENHEGKRLIISPLLHIIIILCSTSPSASVPQDKLDEDPHYNIVKVTILNEVGSLSRILNAFHVSLKSGKNIKDDITYYFAMLN